MRIGLRGMFEFQKHHENATLEMLLRQEQRPLYA